jgi:hypothetical protein
VPRTAPRLTPPVSRATCVRCHDCRRDIPRVLISWSVWPSDRPAQPVNPASESREVESPGRSTRVYLRISATLDHVDPDGRSGSGRGEQNLVTAYWPCNTGKADLRLEEVGWGLLGQQDVRSDWDGLGDAAHELWERARRPDIYRDWRRALASPR